MWTLMKFSRIRRFVSTTRCLYIDSEHRQTLSVRRYWASSSVVGISIGTSILIVFKRCLSVDSERLQAELSRIDVLLSSSSSSSLPPSPTYLCVFCVLKLMTNDLSFTTLCWIHYWFTSIITLTIRNTDIFGDPDETHSVYIMTEPQELVYKRWPLLYLRIDL